MCSMPAGKLKTASAQNRFQPGENSLPASCGRYRLIQKLSGRFGKALKKEGADFHSLRSRSADNILRRCLLLFAVFLCFCQSIRFKFPFDFRRGPGPCLRASFSAVSPGQHRLQQEHEIRKAGASISWLPPVALLSVRSARNRFIDLFGIRIFPVPFKRKNGRHPF